MNEAKCMQICEKCGNPKDDNVSECPVCGDRSVQPIWLTNVSDEPLDDDLDDAPYENPSQQSAGPQQRLSGFQDRFGPTHDSKQGDFFDDTAEAASSFWGNISPKMKRFILFMIISTLLSAIPFLYISCSQNKNDASSSKSSNEIDFNISNYIKDLQG
jgi:hypothetical protein